MEQAAGVPATGRSDVCDGKSLSDSGFRSRNCGPAYRGFWSFRGRGICGIRNGCELRNISHGQCGRITQWHSHKPVWDPEWLWSQAAGRSLGRTGSKRWPVGNRPSQPPERGPADLSGSKTGTECESLDATDHCCKSVLGEERRNSPKNKTRQSISITDEKPTSSERLSPHHVPARIVGPSTAFKNQYSICASSRCLLFAF